MTTITHQQFLAWLGLAAPGMDLTRLKDLLRVEGKSFPLPQTALDAFDWARFLSAQWEKQERVLITLEDRVFTEAEELELYCAYIHTVVGKPIDHGDALVFEPNASSFATVLAMHMMFKWDCIALSADQCFLEISHNDLICALGFNESFYESLPRITRGA